MLRFAVLIGLATWIYIADTTSGLGKADGAARAGGAGPGGPAAAGNGAAAGPSAAGRDLMPYQRLFATLPSEDQRMFRELREGLLEAENARSATRLWPAPAALAERGIPPFADVAAPRQRSYRWVLGQDGLYVNYLGVAAQSGAPAFLLLVQEPDPQAPADTAAPPAGTPDDEVHHRLADGTVLHVSIWMRRAGQPGAPGAAGDRPDVAGPAVTAQPYAQGWTQLLVGANPP